MAARKAGGGKPTPVQRGSCPRSPCPARPRARGSASPQQSAPRCRTGGIHAWAVQEKRAHPTSWFAH
eukprot:6356876-Alexandrium_andersonii.AAC.1